MTVFAGVVQVVVVAFVYDFVVQSVPPTVVVKVGLKFCPVKVMAVPPAAARPTLGEIDVIVGAALAVIETVLLLSP